VNLYESIPTTKWFCYAVLRAGKPNHFGSGIDILNDYLFAKNPIHFHFNRVKREVPFDFHWQKRMNEDEIAWVCAYN
jgi:hypothetical protein